MKNENQNPQGVADESPRPALERQRFGRVLRVYLALTLFYLAAGLSLVMANERPLTVDDAGIVVLLTGLAGAVVGGTVVGFLNELK